MAKGLKTGGRRPGSKNKVTVAVEAACKTAALGLPVGFTSLMLFQAVYRDERHDMELRMAAAAKALPYEHPSLASVTHKGDAENPLRFVNEAAESLDAKFAALAKRRTINEASEDAIVH